MKTSKIIFIALLSTIALIILSALIDLRLNGKRYMDRKKDFKISKLKISSIRVLCINENNSIELVQSDSAYFEITVMKDSLVPKLNFTISGDTLKIADQMVKTGKGAWVSIHVDRQFNQILLRKSNLNLANIQSDQLTVDLDQSTLNVNQQNDKKVLFRFLKVSARNNSQFDANELKINSVQVELHHSEANLWSAVNTLSGSMADSSRLRVRQPMVISLKRDSSSSLDIND